MTPPDIKDIEAITKLVDKDGYDPEDLVAVLHALNAIKRNNKKKEDEEAKQENKIFLDKEFVYETREDEKIITALVLDEKCLKTERVGEMLIKINLNFTCDELK